MADTVDRKGLISLLNEDLSREYQAIIAYVIYSQVLKGAEYMAIAGELETHAQQELAHLELVVALQQRVVAHQAERLVHGAARQLQVRVRFALGLQRPVQVLLRLDGALTLPLFRRTARRKPNCFRYF